MTPVSYREEEIDRMLADETPAATLQPRVSNFPPYRFRVDARSNLRFSVWRVQEAWKPGFAVALYASLSEYDVPLERHVSVWAEVTRPDQSTFTMTLTPGAEGIYTGGFLTTVGGVYICRVRADGYASRGTPFTREQTLTAGSI